MEPSDIEVDKNNIAQTYKNYLASPSDKGVECRLQKVQGLKLFLSTLGQPKISFIYYFSQLKLIKPKSKEAIRKTFQEVEHAILELCHSRILLLTASNYQVFEDEVSLYGGLTVKETGLIIRNQLLRRRKAQFSKNAETLLGTKEFNQIKLIMEQSSVTPQQQQLAKKAPVLKNAFKQEEQQAPVTKPGNNTKSIQYDEATARKYRHWIDQQKRLDGRTGPDVLNQLLTFFRIQDLHPNKLLLLCQTLICLLHDSRDKKQYLEHKVQFFKLACPRLAGLCFGQTKLQSPENLRTVNTMLRVCISCLGDVREHPQFFRQHEQTLKAETEKVVKLVFKLNFLGNAVFHQKVFNKAKELELSKFQFNTAQYSGASSMSEMSETDAGNEQDRISRKYDNAQYRKRKLPLIQLKVRISASQLLAIFFKSFPVLLETQWQLCVKANILTEQFSQHLRMFIPSATSQGLEGGKSDRQLSEAQKKQIVNLMRLNFGQHTLLSLLMFEDNYKVKLNLLNSLSCMICNFQGRKIIPSLDLALFEKQYSTGKSTAFISKSFAIYSAYRNIFCGLLFCAYYERSVPLAVQVVKAIGQIAEQTALFDKMSYTMGIELLIKGFIEGVLLGEAHRMQITDLKAAAVACLNKVTIGAHSHNLEKLLFDKGGVCHMLLQIVESSELVEAEDKLECEINNLFTKIAKFHMTQFTSCVWERLEKAYRKCRSSSFCKVVQQLCRNLWSMNDEQEDKEQQPQPVQVEINNKINIFAESFTTKYLPEFLKQYETASGDSLLGLFSILCSINGAVWQSASFLRPRNFVLYIFYNLAPLPLANPVSNENQNDFSGVKLNQIKSNPYARVAYIKLVGYLSFQPIFRKLSPTIIRDAFSILLQFSKSAKGLNTLVRCSWALSSWASVPQFDADLSKEMLSQILLNMTNFAQSDKDKVASNGIHGIGAFVKNISTSTRLQQDLQGQVPLITKVLSKSLSSPSPKVSWNCLVTLRTILSSPSHWICTQILNDPKQPHKFMEHLLGNFTRNNYKLHIQTLETLRVLDSSYVLRYARGVLDGVAGVLERSHKQRISDPTLLYSFAEFKYINTLRKQLIQYYAELVLKADSTTLKDIVKNQNGGSLYLFLENLYQFLVQKEDRAGKKFEQKNQELLDQKAQAQGQDVQKQVFNAKGMVRGDTQEVYIRTAEMGLIKEGSTNSNTSNNTKQYLQYTFKLQGEDTHEFYHKIKTASQKLVDLIDTDNTNELKVSFGIADVLQQLCNTEINQQYVRLRVREF